MAIFSMIGAGIASLFGAAVWVGQLIGAGLAYGAQYLLNSYLNRQKKRDYSAVQGQREYGARVPVWALYGMGLVKGHAIYYAKWGAGNKFNADVLVLSNGWCDGLEPEVYFYGEKHTLVARPIIANEAAHYGVDGFDDLISIRFYDGRPGQGPDTKLVTDTTNLGQNWKSTSRCTGLTYVVVERQWSEEKFDKGIPEFEFVLRGLRLYDPRKDSTVAGGSGPQRLGNPSTYQFSRNPAVQRLNYQLGLRGYRSGRTLIGEGKTLGQLDLASYFAAMNVADTLRLGKPTYQSSLLVTSDDDHTEVLKEFDDALAGYGMNRRGLSGVIPGAPQIPVLDIGPADIDMGRSKSTRLRKSAFSLYNQMSGQFTSPEANWTPQSLNPIVINSDITADGRARQVANDFLQVTDPDIAQYLLQIRYRQNRKGGAATVPVSRRVGFNVMEGDWVTYLGKTWLITGWLMNASLEFTLTLAETGPDVYSSNGIEPGPIVVPSPPPTNPSLLATVQNFAVEAGMLNGADGYEVPVLRFTWTPPQDPTITKVRFQYQVDTPESPLIEDSTDNVERGEYITAKGVASGRYHMARATIVTVPDRFKSWTPWISTAFPTGYIAVRALLKDLGEDLQHVIEGMRREMDETKARIEQLALAGADEAQTITRSNEIAVRHRHAVAGVIQEIRAAITDEDGELIAVAEALTAVLAQVGDLFAEGLFRIEARAGAGSVLARIVLMVRASDGAAWADAGMLMEVFTEGGVIKSRIVFNGDQMAWSRGDQRFLPMKFEEGVLTLDVGRIREVIADLIKTPTNKAQFGLLAPGVEGLSVRTG